MPRLSEIAMLSMVALATGDYTRQSPTPRPRAIVLADVTVIDGTGSAARPGMTVLVEGGRIAAIGPNLDRPGDALVIEASGKFLIPGLVDLHVHTSWDEHFLEPLLLANGVTGVREMYAKDPVAIRARRAAIAEGSLLAPRIRSAGPIVDGPGAPWPGSIIVINRAQARAAVDSIKRAGFDFVKVYSGIGRDAYLALADEARKVGIPYLGHLPEAVSAADASDAGQRSFEHTYGLLLACSTRESELRQALRDSTGARKGRDRRLVMLAEQRVELDSYSEEKAAALFARFRQNGTWQVPTLVVMRNASLLSDPEYVARVRRAPELRYVPWALRGMWGLALRFAGAPLPPAELATSKQYFARQVQLVGEMDRAGVGILAGTDTPNPFVIPGFALHDELELLVEAGLTPMAALQTATRNPAIFDGRIASEGTIEPGKVADLVLLDANPLERIGNTRTIRAVVLGGRLIPRAGLDSLLKKVEASRWRPNPAALILIGLVFRMMAKALLVALLILVGIGVGISVLLKRRARRRLGSTARS